MRGILADNDAVGDLDILVGILQSADWADLWASLDIGVTSFSELGLTSDALDSDLWHACQEAQIVLLTRNRNAHGLNSLEATIRNNRRSDSLPVFTVANPKRLQHERDYAEQVAVRLLEYLMDIESFRGTGRVFLP